MLTDPLPVKSISLGAHSGITVLATDNFAVTDVAPGKSTRKCPALDRLAGCSGQLTISHSVSKENGAVPTDRLLVRMDVSGLTDSSGGGDRRAFAYLVVGVPRNSYYDVHGTLLDPIDLVQLLLGAVGVSPTSAALSEVNLNRMLAGEP